MSGLPFARGLLSCVCVAVFWGLSLLGYAQTKLIDNESFCDADGDGLIDGWEAKTFFLEKDKQNPATKRLTLKIPQESDRQIIGEVTTVFRGAAGYYQITIRYLDENDGISTARLLINGKVVHIWDFDNIFVNYFRNEVVENVYLKAGDKITIWAATDYTEYCRLDSVRVIPSPCPPSAREIEEMKPPLVADLKFGDLVALRDHRESLVSEMRPESRNKCNGGILFYARAGEKVELELFPNSVRKDEFTAGAVYSLGATATGLEGGSLVAADLRALYDEETKSGTAVFTAPEAGFYRFEFRDATPVLKVPHVFPCTAKGKVGLMGAGDFYFFVPKGTKSFALSALVSGDRSAEVLLMNPRGVLHKRTCLEAREELAVRVPDGQDDGVWLISVRGIGPRLVLRGIPPFVATHPRHLLVPRECVDVKK